MNLLRACSAEALKLKRTIALKMVLLAPVAVVLLTLFMASQAPFSTLQQVRVMNAWMALGRVNLQFWGLLMLPLFVTLQTALVAGVDHSDNQWKALFARPVPRWTCYAAKLGVVTAMVVTSGTVLVAGVLLEGRFLHWYNAELGFGADAPVATIARQAAQMTGLSFLAMTVQLWVGLRWRSFAVAIGFGAVALVTAFAMLLAAGQYGAWPQYFPWALPMLVIARYPQNVEMALWVSGAAAVVTAVAGCVDFCRREVS